MATATELVYKHAVQDASASFVFDSFNEVRNADSTSIQLDTRPGSAAAVNGYLSHQSQKSSADVKPVSLLLTPTSLLEAAPALASLPAARPPVIAFVACSEPLLKAGPGHLEAIPSLDKLFTAIDRFQNFKPAVILGGGVPNAPQDIADKLKAALDLSSKGFDVVFAWDAIEAGKEELVKLDWSSASAMDIEAQGKAKLSTAVQAALGSDGLFTYSGPAEPEKLLVLPASLHSSYAIASNPKSGVLAAHVLNPSFGSELLAKIPSSVKEVAVYAESSLHLFRTVVTAVRTSKTHARVRVRTLNAADNALKPLAPSAAPEEDATAKTADAVPEFPEPKPIAPPAWHLAAKQFLFKEAYEVQEEALRPDLPETNFILTVTENRRLTPLDYDRNVFHLELSTEGTGLKYAVGEALGVHGWNDAGDVTEFIEWFGLDPDAMVQVPSREHPRTRGESRTVFQTLQQNLDLFGKPGKSFYEELSKLATDREESRHLRFIGSAEGAATFKKWSDLDTVTYADVIKSFPSVKEALGLEGLLREIPLIKPRHYSIASSQNFVGDSVHLLIVTVDWMTPAQVRRYGQCTRYLADLKVGDQVTVSVKPSVMQLPPKDTQPIIMAGLGTGAAPFRAFIQERQYQRENGIEIGPLLYYFGSRYSSKEFLYGEEIKAWLEDGLVTHAGLAFSRDTKQKVYIQHKMQEDGKLLSDALKDGVFYLCGPTWPVPDVYEALCTALVEHRGQTLKEAQNHLEELKEDERYVLEVY